MPRSARVWLSAPPNAVKHAVKAAVAGCAGGRVVSGHEAVMVTVQAPSGTKSLLPLALEDGAGRYSAQLTCSEVGAIRRQCNTNSS